MATASVPVDLFNPGQVFACLGLLELAEMRFGGASAGFDWSDPGGVRFLVRVGQDVDPIAAGLGFLVRAEVEALVAHGMDLDTDKWSIPAQVLSPGAPFPIPVPGSPATLPARLHDGEYALDVDVWGDVNSPAAVSTGRDRLKFWGGSGGYPGVALLRDALQAARPGIEETLPDPFALSAPQKSSFRFDWRRDYIPIDAGFSLNKHTGIQPRGYPLVEVLAVIGLSNARPQRIDRLQYRYSVAGRAGQWQPERAALLPPLFLRAALGLSPLPFSTRTFTMHLGWPGQENKQRCITTVSEDLIP